MGVKSNIYVNTTQPANHMKYMDVSVYRQKYSKLYDSDTNRTFGDINRTLVIGLSRSGTTCKQDNWDISHILLRLAILILTVVMLTVHVRSLRVFHWEQSFSGGVFVTYCLIALGLSLCSGVVNCEGVWLQVYFAISGTFMYSLNAIVLLVRWKSASQMTRVVAELLVTLGLQIRNLIILKIGLSLTCAVALLLDVALLLKELWV